jgi:Tol biopolymer transport system component
VIRALRFSAVTLIVAAVAGSTGAGAAPRSDPPLLTFALEPSLGVCATDLQGHTFRLTEPRQSGAYLSWSPDGTELVFRSGQSRVSFVDAEGGSQGSLSWPTGDGEHWSTNVSGLAWSPDSRSVAGVLETAYHYGGERWELWVSQAGRTRTLYVGGAIGRPSWSPDGRRVAFSDRTTRKAYVIDEDGSNLREVLASADQPVWSPDGQRLAYVVLDEFQRSVGLAVARADGSGRQRLTEGDVLSPAWSPDGSTIAFTLASGTSDEIDVIRPDGTDKRTVARGAVRFPGPVWSPEGDAIAYARQEEPMGIGLVRPDGTSERIIESGVPGTSLSSPAWRRPAPLPMHRRRCVITGTPRADVLRGKNLGDVLYGDAGSDRIYGAGGRDVLIGGPGHDRLFGGAGDDLFQAKDFTRDYLFGGPGRDRGSYDLGGQDKIKSVEHFDSQ